MKLVHDRGEARWLPSRFRYAIFRMIAWGIHKSSPPREDPGLVLAIDRDQSALEHFAIAVFITVAWTAFVYAALQDVLPWPVAMFAAFLAGTTIPQVIICLPAVGPQRWRQIDRVGLNAWFQWFSLTCVAIVLARAGGWVKVAAGCVLMVLVVNAVAAIAYRLLRDRVPS